MMSAKVDYILHLADNALILGQRNAEWCGHGPVLEQDIAITNISLDLIGQARHFYQYAAQLINEAPENYSSIFGELNSTTKICNEDHLAYLRGERSFKNCLLVELPVGDWAFTILRQFLFSTYQFLLFRSFEKMQEVEPQISAIGAKILKEVSYHLRWSGEWVIRLGDGTEESERRIKIALLDLWPYTGELFIPAEYEMTAMREGYGPDLAALRPLWLEKLEEVFKPAGLTVPENSWMQSGGKEGKHSEYFGFILAELQYLQRAYPDSEW